MKRLTETPWFRTSGYLFLALALAGLGLVGCGDDSPTALQPSGDNSETGVVHGNIAPDDNSFEFISSRNGDPSNPIPGPFAIRGTIIEYDEENGALVVDLTAVNTGEDTYPEPISLTFMSLLPDGVTVENPDNEENGAGAMIGFEFENDDAQWTPDEQSLPRRTQFGVDQGIAIAFVARIDAGGGEPDLGAIGGMVWNDRDGDGEMDEDEPGIGGATLTLMANGRQLATTTSGEGGTYEFEDLASGFYEVTKMQTEGSMPTTARTIQVILPVADGTVASFLAANFGCRLVAVEIEPGSIGGVVFEDTNGNKVRDDGEPGIGAVDVELNSKRIEGETVKTNENGEYLFDKLPADTYEVSASFPEGCTPTTGASLQVKLEEVEGVVGDVLDANFGCLQEPTS